MNFIEELRWRGMLHDIMPGTEEKLIKEKTVGYIGFDPTSDSLHIGNLVPIMILIHFQRAGHKPIVLLGGATGMVGDPSGKSKERNLLGKNEIENNIIAIKKQLKKIITSKDNQTELLNNYDWFKDISLLDFIRDIGKHITVNYMVSKESVKTRMTTGISFTEFTYQLIQAYDFYYLYKNKNCTLQLGGADQWGNIVTGSELIRRLDGKKVFSATTPLITKTDGGKFGKTEEGNIWLDPEKTSPYKFYQFWLNTSDEDAKKYIRIFTLLSKEKIGKLESMHNLAPHERLLQKTLAKDITSRIHSVKDVEISITASRILFGKSTYEELLELDEETIMAIFKAVPLYKIKLKILSRPIHILDLITSPVTNIFSSKSEARRMLNSNSLAINKIKANNETFISKDTLIKKKFILIQKGKKDYHLIKVD